MRNCQEISAATQSTKNTAGNNVASTVSKAVPAAPPPRLPPCPTPRPRPALLPLASAAQLEPALRAAYRDRLGVAAGEEARPVVVLSDRAQDIPRVTAGLLQAGVPPGLVTEYREAGDRPGLETYLAQPAGVLVTTADSFSGMEGASVVYVMMGNSWGTSYRSALLRAVEQLVWITTDRRLAPEGFQVSGQCLPCSSYGCGSDYYSCRTCSSARGSPVTVCLPCANACHQACETASSLAATWRRMLPSSPGCGCGPDCSIPRPASQQPAQP